METNLWYNLVNADRFPYRYKHDVNGVKYRMHKDSDMKNLGKPCKYVKEFFPKRIHPEHGMRSITV